MAFATPTANLVERVGFHDQEYIELLGKLIQHAERVQNNPKANQIPEEKLVADEVIAYLSDSLPGVSIAVHAYDHEKKRPNVIVRYVHPDVDPKGKIITFMGSHFDVVPANIAEWRVDPFSLTKEAIGNDIKLYGRGTTDCLGHVALLAVMIKRLAQNGIALSHEIAAVLIADEEVGEADVGVFRLYQDGLLNDFKRGPIYWLDTATDDGLFGPRVGTGGIGRWSISITGRGGHSGYPHLCINPISVAHALISFMNDCFKRDFQHDAAKHFAKAHLYPTTSTCKCTGIWSQSPGQTIIPEHCSFYGDVRFTPDFSVEQIKAALPRYVAEFNERLASGALRSSGGDGGEFLIVDNDGQKQSAVIDFSWSSTFGEPFVTDMNAPAYKEILGAMMDVRKKAQPFAALGTLPLIAELQARGFSLVPIGFGRQKAYHAANEYCLLSEMADGFRVMVRAIERLCDW